MSQTVADVLIGVLEQIGVKHIFGLIGDSLNPLADAVRRSGIERMLGERRRQGSPPRQYVPCTVIGCPNLGRCCSNPGRSCHRSE
jgi:glyoxylate carboligase